MLVISRAVIIFILLSTVGYAKEESKKDYTISKSLQVKYADFIGNLKFLESITNKGGNKSIVIFEEENVISISDEIEKEYPQIVIKIKSIEAEDKKEKLESKEKEEKFDFYISDEMVKLHPELINLIKNTESMDNDERQYWFDIMPSMTVDQISRLEDILSVEKKKLEELEIKYQSEIKNLNDKHLVEWDEFQLKKKQIKELEIDKTNYDEMISKIENTGDE